MDRNLLLTAVDLTRACSAHEQYLEWLALYEPVLHGSLGIANYFGVAAEAYERARNCAGTSTTGKLVNFWPIS